MSQNVIEVRQLSRRFRAKEALVDVSLSVPQGTVFGLVGGNGAGKTTLIRHFLGLLGAQSGSVRVFGLDPVREPVAVLGRIGYLSEERDLPDWMTVGELMNYTAAFYPRWDSAFATELAGMFELSLNQKIRTLSRGQRARAGLLAALAHRPDLLILDEPSSGLDPVVRRDILAAIIRTVADEGRTIVFSSHLLDEVERVADHVAMLHEGRLVLSSPLEEIKDNHRRLTFRFEQPQTDPPRLAGMLSCTGDGIEYVYLCNGGIDQLKLSAERLGARLVDESVPSLDEIFVSRVTG